MPTADERAREVLPFIPVEALRRKARERASGDVRVNAMTGAQLQRYVRTSSVLTSAEILDLAEEWRYGERVAVTLGIFPQRPKRPGPNFRAELQRALDDASAERGAAAQELGVRILGEDAFDGGHILELPFRYGKVIHYIDLEERPVEKGATAYGFAWLNVRDQYLAVAGDQHIVNDVRDAITTALGSAPAMIRLDKATLDKHFDLRKILSILQLDLTTGTRRRTSGEALYEHEAELSEVLERDRETQRLGVLYHEQIGAGVAINVAVNAERGRITTTRALPASALRAWFAPRLTDLARSLLDVQRDDPQRFASMLRVAAIEDVPQRHADAVLELAAGIALCREKGRDGTTLQRGASELARTLPKRTGHLSARVACGGCGGELVLAHCDGCLTSAVTEFLGKVMCAACGGTTRSCLAGHPLSVSDVAASLTYEAEPLLHEWISHGLAAMQFEAYRPTEEHFWVRGNELRYQAKAQLQNGTHTAFVIDIEGSTALQRRKPREYRELVQLVRGAVETSAKARDGRLMSDTGDGAIALFPSARSAVDAAREVQAAVRASAHNKIGAWTRVGLATGQVTNEGGHYAGVAINCAERLQKKATRGTRIALDTKTLMGAKQPAIAIGKMRELHGFEDAGEHEEYFLLEERRREDHAA